MSHVSGRRLVVLALFACFGWACAPAASVPPTSPEPANSAVAPAPPEPVSPPSAALPAAPGAVPPPDSACLSLLEAPTAGACADRAAALEGLDAALGLEDPVGRDRALAALESCSEFERGLVRALRADLAPSGCGDVLVERTVSEGRLGPDVRDALVGLAMAARLSRMVGEPPALAPPYDKKRVLEFLSTTLGPWIRGQASAIHEIAVVGSKLSGYGRGVAAVEAGLADMRFVELARQVPIPPDINDAPDLKDAYFGALDQALEQRKARGRQAALAGLEVFAELGVLSDPRVDSARKLLSTLYRGHRIDALDGLMLSDLAPLETEQIAPRLATRLPTFYANKILAPTDATETKLLRGYLERGLPPNVKARLDASEVPAEVTFLHARALVELGQRYWRAQDFERAAILARKALASGTKRKNESELLSALGVSLAKGPKNAAVMMRFGPRLPPALERVEALDTLVKKGGPMAGAAAYDAAFLLELVPPRSNAQAYFNDVARRYRLAATLLKSPERKKRALDRAKNAADIAKAVPAAE